MDFHYFTYFPELANYITSLNYFQQCCYFIELAFVIHCKSSFYLKYIFETFFKMN